MLARIRVLFLCASGAVILLAAFTLFGGVLISAVTPASSRHRSRQGGSGTFTWALLTTPLLAGRNLTHQHPFGGSGQAQTAAQRGQDDCGMAVRSGPPQTETEVWPK
jgi:hypothetical protein